MVDFEHSKHSGNSGNGNFTRKFHKFNWSACVEAVDEHALSSLSKWRGLSQEFCCWLHARNLIGLHNHCFAFPVHGDDDQVVACHFRLDNGTWAYHPPGTQVRPLIFGEPAADAVVLVFESQWDAFAVADKFGLHESQAGGQKLIFVVTRGANHGALVQEGIPAGCSGVFAFPQNDEVKNGTRACEQWLKKVISSAEVPVRRVEIPAEHKDANDWTRAGATVDAIFAAMEASTVVPKIAFISLPDKNIATAHGTPVVNESFPAEIAELVELARVAFAEKSAAPANSTNSAGDHAQPAIFPLESILTIWMDFARAQEESADPFLLGSILPVCAAILGRCVYFNWGERRQFSNLFVMLVGKPGDRKSSIIMLGEKVARCILPVNAFLPASFSPEAMFNEYAEETGGQPDKLWIVDDANATLKDWQKSVNGERVATRFLELYDCKGISESFQRNRKESEKGEARRVIEQTSTSLLFGATFNIAAFQGQEVRAGMSRRFLYYVAEKHGRLIVRPSANASAGLNTVVKAFRKLLSLSGAMDFTPEAAATWGEYQRMNRDEMDEIDPLREAEIARLSSAPMQTLSIAMIFEACCWAKTGGPVDQGDPSWNARLGNRPRGRLSESCQASRRHGEPSRDRPGSRDFSVQGAARPPDVRRLSFRYAVGIDQALLPEQWPRRHLETGRPLPALHPNARTPWRGSAGEEGRQARNLRLPRRGLKHVEFQENPMKSTTETCTENDARHADEPVPAWERRPEEPTRWFARFNLYRLLGSSRSIDGAWRQEPKEKTNKNGRAPDSWHKAAKRFQWRDRALAWDIADAQQLSQQVVVERARRLKLTLQERQRRERHLVGLDRNISISRCKAEQFE